MVSEMNWKFWTWHLCKCYTQSDNDGVWGECVICHKRYGYVTREELRSYCDRELDIALRKAGVR